MTSSFHIIMRKEGKQYIGKILENNVSSFGKTEKECIKNTKEALDLYLEDSSPKEHVAIQSPRLLSFEHNYV